MEDITAEDKEEDNTTRTFARGCPSSTMLGVDGVAGDRRLPSKQKSKGFDAPPALGDAENATPGEDPPAAAAAPTAAATVDAAAAASETPPTPPPPAGKRASGGRR